MSPQSKPNKPNRKDQTETTRTPQGKRENTTMENPKSSKKKEHTRPRGMSTPHNRSTVTNLPQTAKPSRCYTTPRAPLPTYNLPRFTREQSAPPPPSPTNEALKRRKLQNQNQGGPSDQQTGQEEGMAVDDDTPHPPEQANMPTPANKRHWYDEAPANQADEAQYNNRNTPSTNLRLSEVTVKVDEQENTKTMARLLVATERPVNEEPSNTSNSPTDKYTKGQMPEIHDSNLMTLLASLDGAQIQDWLEIPMGKVLARPFDSVVNYQPKHKDIAKLLLEPQQKRSQEQQQPQ
ncbi:hypothetical protein EDB86DRAFT_2831865 [Lactarius hatsudake]|nr:hypothetical protein EDB86DRAFT_2831865 [Lactarius hatsudake]